MKSRRQNTKLVIPSAYCRVVFLLFGVGTRDKFTEFLTLDRRFGSPGYITMWNHPKYLETKRVKNVRIYTMRSESRCAFTSIEVAVEVCCCCVIFHCIQLLNSG
jgi:hypothetical protein